MAGVRRKAWGAVCGVVAAVFVLVAAVVVLSKLQVMVDHPLSFATAVLLAAVVGAVACGREARRALT